MHASGPTRDTAARPAGDVVVPRAWFAARLAACPPDLARAIESSLDSSTSAGLTSCALGFLGIEWFEQVGAAPQTREAALALLAADALLTYAFESAADPAIGGSAAAATELAALLGPRGELGRRAAGRSPGRAAREEVP